MQKEGGLAWEPYMNTFRCFTSFLSFPFGREQPWTLFSAAAGVVVVVVVVAALSMFLHWGSKLAVTTLVGNANLGEWSLKNMRWTRVSSSRQLYSGDQTIYSLRAFWGLRKVIWAKLTLSSSCIQSQLQWHMSLGCIQSWRQPSPANVFLNTNG